MLRVAYGNDADVYSDAAAAEYADADVDGC